jgi:hypothetical protein
MSAANTVHTESTHVVSDLKATIKQLQTHQTDAQAAHGVEVASLKSQLERARTDSRDAQQLQTNLTDAQAAHGVEVAKLKTDLVNAKTVHGVEVADLESQLATAQAALVESTKTAERLQTNLTDAQATHDVEVAKLQTDLTNARVAHGVRLATFEASMKQRQSALTNADATHTRVVSELEATIKQLQTTLTDAQVAHGVEVTKLKDETSTIRHKHMQADAFGKMMADCYHKLVRALACWIEAHIDPDVPKPVHPHHCHQPRAHIEALNEATVAAYVRYCNDLREWLLDTVELAKKRDIELSVYKRVTGILQERIVEAKARIADLEACRLAPIVAVSSGTQSN